MAEEIKRIDPCAQCPMSRITGVCMRPYDGDTCELFHCIACDRDVPWCVGHGSEAGLCALCDDCCFERRACIVWEDAPAPMLPLPYAYEGGP